MAQHHGQGGKDSQAFYARTATKGYTQVRLFRHLMPICFLLLASLLIAGSSDDLQFISNSELTRLQKEYGKGARLRGEALNHMLVRAKDGDTQEKLVAVNRFFNRFHYVEDKVGWGKEDYWQTPVEFIGNNKGDCEDYVIAKYFSLLALGVDEKRLYLTYVKAVKQNVAHMVLSYFDSSGSVPLILDNYEPRILPATKRSDLIPVYSFNAESLFLANSAGLGTALPTDKLKNSKWDELLKRIKKDKQ